MTNEKNYAILDKSERGNKMQKTKYTSYSQIKKQHSNDVSEFTGLFWAFNTGQLEKGLIKIGLTEDDTNKIVSIGMGGYVRKDKAKDLINMFKRHTAERKEFRKNEKLLVQAICYELFNHEYSYTGDVTNALESLGIDPKEIEPRILKRAIKLHNKERIEK